MKNAETKMEQTAKPLNIGETVMFDRVLKTYVDTKFGAAVALKFIKDRKIIRQTFAGKGLLDFLEQNKAAKQVTLVDKITDGNYTHNIYE